MPLRALHPAAHPLLTPPPEATREEMSAARLPLAYRDSCAHLLIPLNRCRVDEYYLPWKCEVRRFPSS
jgi:NADH dehydrogenase (ubiquinone) 1 beta subcomplex subunit 7